MSTTIVRLDDDARQHMDGDLPGSAFGQKAGDWLVGSWLKFLHSCTKTIAVPIDMAGAEHTLVLGTAGSAQTQLTGAMIFADANTASAPENLVLPAASAMTGIVLCIKNVGGEQITVNTSVMTLEAGEGGFVVSDGTSWAGFGVGANT